MGCPGAGEVLFQVRALLNQNLVFAVDNPHVHHHHILSVGQRLSSYKGFAGAVSVDVIDVADLVRLLFPDDAGIMGLRVLHRRSLPPCRGFAKKHLKNKKAPSHILG